MGFRVDKRLKLDKPRSHNYMSSETRPIKVTNLDPENIRANEIAIENSKTGKVTAVVAVIYLCRDKLCNSRSAKREPLAKNCQKSASKSKKSKRSARICHNVAMRDDLAKDRIKASQRGGSESHDNISTSLKEKPRR
jgi:hypothetical protein